MKAEEIRKWFTIERPDNFTSTADSAMQLCLLREIAAQIAEHNERQKAHPKAVELALAVLQEDRDRSDWLGKIIRLAEEFKKAGGVGDGPNAYWNNEGVKNV